MAHVVCPRCQRANPGEAVFCYYDGAELRSVGGSPRFHVLPDELTLPSLYGRKNGPHELPAVKGIPVPEQPASEPYVFLSPAIEPDELGQLSHYRVLHLLGEGGMGLVFLAEDMHLRRSVALKVLKPEKAKDFVARQRFLREARAMAAINNEHIVTIYEVGQANDIPFFAMELLQGVPLDVWLERKPEPALDQVLELALQLTAGLETAHKTGLIHRDIKPSNIWLEESSWRIKILDFGLARLAQDNAELTQDGDILGTPAYMAPEQADGVQVDERCDLFSMGCVLYELATGERPFAGTSTLAVMKSAALTDPTPLCEMNPALPRAFSDLVMQLLAKNPADRPASATEVLRTLQEMASTLTLPSPPRRGERGWGEGGRRRAPEETRGQEGTAIRFSAKVAVGYP